MILSKAATAVADTASHLAVPEFVQRLVDTWWSCPSSTPDLGRTYTPREQADREKQLVHLLDLATAEARRPPQSEAERSGVQERILAAFRAFARSALDWQERHLDVVLSRGMPEAAADFARMARRFDAKIDPADIYQASRNVWTANGLQLLLGLPARLTPALFAYSMLYPYTDNYIDDRGVSEQIKAEFSRRFERRLEGAAVDPANDHERAIFDLVAIIEGEFDRARSPQVFQSLLAIHHAQGKSVELLRRNASPYEVDVLGISMEKGGASVLADGYLAAGSLTPAQAEFMFGMGAFLQLGDDLEDVLQDSKDGLMTVFSQTARRWPLDGLTNRTLHFSRRVIARMDCFDGPDAAALRELIETATVQAFAVSAGRAAELYTRGYVREVEAHSPFRFSILQRQLKRLNREQATLMRLAAAVAAV